MSFRFIKKRGYNNNLKAKRLYVRSSVKKNVTDVKTLDVLPVKEDEKMVVDTTSFVERPNETIEEPVQNKRRKKNKQVDVGIADIVVELENETENEEKTEVFENNEQNIE